MITNVCNQTVFCSRRCQDEAMATYHVTESKFMDVLFQHGLRKKEWFLALRTVTMKPLAYFLEQGIGDHDPDFGTADGLIYDGQDFKSLYNLVGHHSEWSFKEHAYKAFFSLFFVRCLQKSNYFGESQSTGGELNQEELLIGTLMIHIMEVAMTMVMVMMVMAVTLTMILINQKGGDNERARDWSDGGGGRVQLAACSNQGDGL